MADLKELTAEELIALRRNTSRREVVVDAEIQRRLKRLEKVESALRPFVDAWKRYQDVLVWAKEENHGYTDWEWHTALDKPKEKMAAASAALEPQGGEQKHEHAMVCQMCGGKLFPVTDRRALICPNCAVDREGHSEK